MAEQLAAIIHGSGRNGPDKLPERATMENMHHTMQTEVGGLAIEQQGYILNNISTPSAVGETGTIEFRISDAAGNAVTDFDDAHGKKVHMIVVRSDGDQFHHVHPVMDQHGTWSLPWTWEAAGTYRVFVDIVPSATGTNITLSRTIHAAGEFVPGAPVAVSTETTVGGFDVSLTGTLGTNTHSMLHIAVSRDGQPVTALEPYLGAYGHLVALREGDLAYLHVHPDGPEAAEGGVSGPDIEFMTQAPTPGRYLLFLDFQVAGQVHTAKFVVDAAYPDANHAHASHDAHAGH